MYDYYVERLRKRVRPSLIGLLGQFAAVQRHFINYADLLKIRYAKFQCLIMVGTEDRLVREANSYMIQRVDSSFLIKIDLNIHRYSVVDWLNLIMLDMVYKLNILMKLIKNYSVDDLQIPQSLILLLI